MGAVALVGFDDQPFTARPMCTGTDVCDVTADDEARSESRLGQDQHQH